MTGADGVLAAGFHRELVEPLLSRHAPRLRYAAARLGSGSDVLGFDDAMSRDHDWGCRLTVLVDAADRTAVPELTALLEAELPETYRGLPVRFPTTWAPHTTHQVEIATVGDFAASRLGADPLAGMSSVDWLAVTGQSVLEVTAGPVFVDRITELSVVREALRWYPPELDRYVLAAAWQQLVEWLPMVGRTAERGDELGSLLLCGKLTDELIQLGFLLRRRWPPYRKWRGTAFATLPGAAELTPALDRAAAAARTARREDGLAAWREREEGLVEAAELLLGWQRDLGLPTPDHAAQPFFERPYRGVNPEVPAMLRGSITDPEVAQLPGMGSIEQWVDNVAVLTDPLRRRAAAAAYQDR